MTKIIAIAVAGSLGALARYGLAGAVQRAFGPGFPWGTAVVNIAGCFAFGLLWAAAQERELLSPEVRTIVLVGFLGAFTTFSTFVFESGQLFSDRELLLGLGNLALQVLGGLAVFFVGQACGRII